MRDRICLVWLSRHEKFRPDHLLLDEIILCGFEDLFRSRNPLRPDNPRTRIEMVARGC